MSGKLKPGWKKVKFGDIVRNANLVERNPEQAGIDRIVGLEHLDPENLHIKRWATIEDGTSFSRKFVPGQTLFGKRRAYQKKVAFAEFEGICSGDILTFESKDPKVLLPELLPFLCQTDAFFKYALGTSAGSLSPRTSWTALKDFAFPLPPIEEQKRIAEVLWAADMAGERFCSAHKAVEAVINPFFEEWFSLNAQNKDTLHLERFANVSYGITLNAKRRKLISKRPYLRVANVQRNFLSLSDISEVGCSRDEEYLYYLELNDVLVVEGHANIDEIGRAAIWKGQIENCIHQNHLLRIRCNSDVNPLFILIYINSVIGKKYFRSVAKSTSGLYTINSTVLKKMPIPVVPINEQNELIELSEEYEKALNESAKHIDNLIQLKKKLINNYIRS